MKKNKLRVIQISGIRGLLSALFVVMCLIAGFVGFPALMLCNIWNHFTIQSDIIPQINIFQGVILWGILAVSYLILNKKQKYLIAFEHKNPSPQELKNIINEIKSQSMEIKKEMDLETPISNPLDTNEIKITAQNEEDSKEKTKEIV